MSEISVFENLYQEELYHIPARALILIDKEWSLITDDEKVLLSKILGSVKLGAASVQILHADDTTVNDLSALNPSRVISFGVRVNPIQKMYEYIPLDGMHIIVADAISALDDTRKKNLWVALRQMFSL